MKKYVLPVLIAISAISISATAAFYSITGLSQLFAGASLAVIIMASALELSKLVMASLLYQFRKTLPKLLKIYLTISTVILILITSMGIYGFLSNAFMIVSQQSDKFDQKISFLETRKQSIENRILILNEEKQSLNSSSQELRAGLSSNTIQYKDKETGQIITTTSSATRKTLQNQLSQIQEREDKLDIRIDSLNNIYFNLNDSISNLQLNNNIAAELGPLLYISEVTGTDMKRVVNWLILIIVLVFDPLAISLVVAANFAFEKIKTPLESSFKDKKINLIKYPESNPTPKKISDQPISVISTPEPNSKQALKPTPQLTQYWDEVEKIRKSNSAEYKKNQELKDLKRKYF